MGAAQIVNTFLEQENAIERVVFVCFGQRDYHIYLHAVREIFDAQASLQPE